MTDPRIQGAGQPASTPAPQSRTVSGPGSGARFEALLERLQSRTHELRGASDALEQPGGLSHAVDTSRASLEDAKALHQEIVEAVRARMQRKSA
jgi:hypothetical protein